MFYYVLYQAAVEGNLWMISTHQLLVGDNETRTACIWPKISRGSIHIATARSHVTHV